MPTSAQLERKAERARQRISDRIADLRSHVSPTTVVSDLLGAVNARNLGDDVLPILAKQARNNPIASPSHSRRRWLADIFRVRGPVSNSLGLPKYLRLQSSWSPRNPLLFQDPWSDNGSPNIEKEAQEHQKACTALLMTKLEPHDPWPLEFRPCVMA